MVLSPLWLRYALGFVTWVVGESFQCGRVQNGA